MDFHGRTAIVTGAGSGIGAATARLLASAGAAVWCADIDLSAAAAVAEAIVAAGGTAVPRAVDVTREADDDELVAAIVATHGAVDMAFLNAGIIAPTVASVLDTTLDAWERVMAVNLRGTFLGLRAVGRAMAGAGRGSIVLTSSLAGLRASAGTCPYAVSKHGILGLAKVAAVDLAPHGIRVNAICPGIIDTPIFDRKLGTVADRRQVLDATVGASVPLGRVGTAEEVAALAAFLLGDDASYITGGTFTIDGGTMAGSGVNATLQQGS